jgi:hypothetical protein
MISAHDVATAKPGARFAHFRYVDDEVHPLISRL